MRKYIPGLAALATLLVVTAFGCGKGGSPSVRLSDIVPMTSDTLETILMGERDIPATRTAPADRPLLEKGKFEAVVVAADTAGFAQVSRGALSKEDVADLRHRVVENLRKRLTKQGFTASEGEFPATVSTEKTLLATITPETQQSAATEGRGTEKRKTLVLIRVTITDPKTGEILARRDYYSGTDARRPGERDFKGRMPFRRSL